MASVRCDCGTRKIVAVDDLLQCKTKSCGCLRTEVARMEFDSLENRFWSKVDKNGPVSDYRPDLGKCWIWTASVNAKGYGIMGVNIGSTMVHRISWSIHGYDIQKGEQIDHLCRVRCCVNPNHLEVVSPKVNSNRGYGPTAKNARKTHCPKGHPYSGENLYLYVGGKHKGNRQCRICGRERQREYQKRKRANASCDA